MRRYEIKKFINTILENENAKAINEDDLLIASELDSFGYAILFIELDEKYNCFDKEYINNINYKTITLRDLCDRIENAN